MPVKNMAAAFIWAVLSGGPAAVLAQQALSIWVRRRYPDSAWKLSGKGSIRRFPAFITVDDKGNDFFNRCQQTVR